MKEYNKGTDSTCSIRMGLTHAINLSPPLSRPVSLVLLMRNGLGTLFGSNGGVRIIGFDQ